MDAGPPAEDKTNQANTEQHPVGALAERPRAHRGSASRDTEQQHRPQQVQQMSKIDASLPVGQATVTVEVTSEIPLLQSETSSLGQVVEFFSIFNHPQFGPPNGTCLKANNANFRVVPTRLI